MKKVLCSIILFISVNSFAQPIDLIFITNSTDKILKSELFYKTYFDEIKDYCVQDSTSQIKYGGIGLKDYYLPKDSWLHNYGMKYSKLKQAFVTSIIFISAEKKFDIPKDYDFLNLYASLNNESLMNTFRESFYNVFNCDIIDGKETKTNENGYCTTLYKYNSKSIEIAFLKLYPSPNNTFIGYSSQMIYNVIFKLFVTDYIKDLSLVLSNKELISKYSKIYISDFRNKKNFHGTDVPYYGLKELEETKEFENYGYTQWLEGTGRLDCKRLFGFILRRNIDGTLPTILKIIRTIIHDYDIELYNGYSAKLI